MLLIALFLFVLAGYLATLCPGIFVGDSSQLITSSVCLGISHPPGYPLHTLLGKIFTIAIAFGNPAYRVNVMEAVFASLCVVVLYKILEMVRVPPWIAALGVLLTAFSKTFWANAVMVKPYMVNLFFILALLLILLRWEKDKNHISLLLLVFFLLGLAMGNHYLVCLAIPAMLPFLVAGKMSCAFHAKTIFRGILWSLMGFSIFLFLWIRSHADPLLDWGNPENLKNFFDHLSRKQYQSMEFAQGFILSIKTQFLKSYGRSVLTQINPWFIPFELFGLWRLFQLHKRFLISLLILLVAYSVGVIGALNFPFNDVRIHTINNYYALPSYLTLSLAVIVGFHEMHQRLRSRVGRWMLGLILCFSLVSQGRANWPKNNRRSYFGAYDYAKNFFHCVPLRSHIFPIADTPMFIAFYQRHVLGRRLDALIMANTTHRWMAEELTKNHPELVPMSPHQERSFKHQLIFGNINRFPMITEGVHEDLMNHLVPRGIAYEVKTTQDPFEKARAVKDQLFLWELMIERPLPAIILQEDYYMEQLNDLYSMAHNNAGVMLEAMSKDLARKHYLQALVINPSNQVARRNLEDLNLAGF